MAIPTILKRSFQYSLMALGLLLPYRAAQAENMTVSLIGMGNIFLVDTSPQLDPGPGGGVSFDYRLNSRFSIETTVLVTTHSGIGTSSGDGSIEFLGIPTVDLKYYFLNQEGKFEPYVAAGVGAYAISEGSREDGTNGVGMGSQLSVGVDYYVSESFSLGFEGTFRSIAIISSLSAPGTGESNATALLPYTLAAKVGFHF